MLNLHDSSDMMVEMEGAGLMATPDYIPRDISDTLRYLTSKFPVTYVTGPRQSGKSTLLQQLYPKYLYVNLEEPDTRLSASQDPRGFLSRLGRGGVIIDEAQRVPELFSYIQLEVDANNRPGSYLLSGSQNFALMRNISQSLAGRVGILTLLPFSLSEMKRGGLFPGSLDDWVFRGAYPRSLTFDIAPPLFFPGYVQTYIERDVRAENNVGDLNKFLQFLKVCAARVGRQVNLSDIGNAISADARTIQSWLSILEASYIIYLLRPYYKNFGKRVTKTPKMYFCDTGLACSLLEIERVEQLNTHYLRGHLFENAVISEFCRHAYNEGKRPGLFYWRETESKEIDLLVERGECLDRLEVKTAQTADVGYAKNLLTFSKGDRIPNGDATVIYDGPDDLVLSGVTYRNWRSI